MMLANLYEYRPSGKQFIGNFHVDRSAAEYAAAEELRIERNTRRVALIRCTQR